MKCRHIYSYEETCSCIFYLIIYWNKNIKMRYLSVQGGKGDNMNLTRYKQEVVINLNAEEDMATVYSANPA